jgi:hypothetical protein
MPHVLPILNCQSGPSNTAYISNISEHLQNKTSPSLLLKCSSEVPGAIRLLYPLFADFLAVLETF